MEVYRDIITWPTRTGARTKDSDIKKFATTNHTLSPFSIKEAWILTWIFWGTLVHNLLHLLAFQIKSLFLAPTTSWFTALSFSEQYKIRLGSMRENREGTQNDSWVWVFSTESWYLRTICRLSICVDICQKERTLSP